MSDCEVMPKTDVFIVVDGFTETEENEVKNIKEFVKDLSRKFVIDKNHTQVLCHIQNIIISVSQFFFETY